MFLSIGIATYTQQVSGYWQGRLGNHILGLKVDLKLILIGDSIVGTCYYYTSKNSYVQYSVKGTFNPKTNAVVWYDDKLLKTKNANTLLKAKQNGPMISEVNYNCPGGDKMTLDGKATDAAKKNKNETTINLTKTDKPSFDDDWNVVLDNWTQGGNNPELILSITNKIDKYVPNNNGVVIAQIYNVDTPKNEQTTVTTLNLPVKKLENIPVDNNTVNQKPDGSTTYTITNKDKPPVSDSLNTAVLEPAFNKPGTKDNIATITTNLTTENKVEVSKTLTDKYKVTVTDTMPDANTRNVAITFLQINKPNPIKKGTEINASAVGEINNTANIPSALPQSNTATVPQVATANTSAVGDIKKLLPEYTIAKKYVERQKQVLAYLPLVSDSMVLNFYDNAEVDGDSIALFINGTLLQQHILLTDKPYAVTLYARQLTATTELTMVAENLGSIPPNTSYMVTYINGKKYEATLSSTEKTSAVIRFAKKE